MKYAPKKIYIKENNEYIELEYDEFCKRRSNDNSFWNKRFIPVQACLLEVDEQNYKEYYQEKERYRHIRNLDHKHMLSSIAAMIHYLEEEDFAYIEAGPEYDVEANLIHKMMLEKLSEALLLLSADELIMIDLIYSRCMTRREAADEIGIPKSTFEYRLCRLLDKLRSLMES